MSNQLNILVTGGAGFLGSHLCEVLLKDNHKVFCLDNFYSSNKTNIGKLENHSNFTFLNQDVCHLNINFEIDQIYNLACPASPIHYQLDPVKTIQTNILGSINVLELAKKNNAIILQASTSEVYGSAKYVPIDENHPFSAQSPYSASKISADHLALSYYNSFKLPIKIVRPFNIYGPRQSERAVIPSIIMQALNNKKEIRLGNVKPTRDLTYVSDTCDAFLDVLKIKNFFGNTLNVGSNNEYTIEEIAKKIIKKVNSKAIILKDQKRVRSKNSEVIRLVCDNRKILEKTNWKPTINIDKGLDQTIAWYKKFKYLFAHNIYHV